VLVAGRWAVQDRQIVSSAPIGARFADAMQQLASSE